MRANDFTGVSVFYQLSDHSSPFVPLAPGPGPVVPTAEDQTGGAMTSCATKPQNNMTTKKNRHCGIEPLSLGHPRRSEFSPLDCHVAHTDSPPPPAPPSPASTTGSNSPNTLTLLSFRMRCGSFDTDYMKSSEDSRSDDNRHGTPFNSNQGSPKLKRALQCSPSNSPMMPRRKMSRSSYSRKMPFTEQELQAAFRKSEAEAALSALAF